jgi:membrane-associated phospholipid phosphatase
MRTFPPGPSPRRRLPGLVIGALALAVAASACSDVNRDEATATTTATRTGISSAEPTAGTWRTWVLSSGDEIPVAPPPAAGSPEAKAEEQELRDAVAKRTPEVADFVKKWSGDDQPLSAPWMEMALEFISAREKDPAASSRAYGLLAVAAYDATVAAWNAKYRYNRPAPDVVERLAQPGPDPSYPNEHATVAGAASKVLAYLFPERPAPRLDEAAEQAADSRVLAGAARRSDVEAGLDLGHKVAEKVIAYGKADGSDREWDGQRPPGIGRGPQFWEPQPGSVANPVSPLAGTWKTWVLTSGRQFRPGPPPAFGSPEFLAQAREVIEAKKTLTEDQKRAAKFWAGGQGTPLPAGVWNQVTIAYLRDLKPTHPQAERAMALANVAMADAGIAAWDTKFAYWDPRPENGVQDVGLEKGWEPYLVDTPFFPSYISGHSTYSGAIAEVLSFLFPTRTKDFEDKALEASNSRLWGGIHWRKDSEVGLDVGKKVGQAVIERAKTDRAPAFGGKA